MTLFLRITSYCSTNKFSESRLCRVVLLGVHWCRRPLMSVVERGWGLGENGRGRSKAHVARTRTGAGRGRHRCTSTSSIYIYKLLEVAVHRSAPPSFPPRRVFASSASRSRPTSNRSQMPPRIAAAVMPPPRCGRISDSQNVSAISS